MFPIRRILAAITVIVVSAAAGAGARAATGSQIYGGYAGSIIVGATLTSGLPTVIRGSLGGQTGAALADKVRGMLALPQKFSRISFVAGPESPTGLRLVILINPDNVIQAGRRLCGDVSALTYGATGHRFIMLTAFCRDTWPLTEVDTREAPIASADEPRFRRALDEAMSLAFPVGQRASPGSMN
ncbi:MAG: hypothetical protein EXQ85_09850 [Alphaproteobacteria bacterium]|nr:hypothetical protein [Alphaproteobacteria bacterium]